MKVRDLMSREVRVCSTDDSLNQAARVMWEHDVGFLPVVDAEGSVVGVITDRDICMAAYTQGVSLAEGRVWSAMSRQVISARADDSLGSVEEAMSRHQIRRMPVLDEFDRAIGVIALGDLARHSEANALRKALEAPGVAKTVAAISTPRVDHAAE